MIFSHEMKQICTLFALSLFLTLSAYATPVYYAADDDTDDHIMAQLADSTQYTSQMDESNQDQYDESVAVGTSVETAKPAKKRGKTYDNWTIGLKGGINYFTLTLDQASPQTGTNGQHFGVFSDISQQVAIHSEYSFDYGLAVGAYFGNYSYNRYAVLGSSIELGLYSHINLLECFVWHQPLPIARRLHIFWDLGLGAGALWQNNQIAGDAYSSDTVKWMAAAVLRTALQIEFMIRPHWGLMIEGEYHGYGRPLSYQQDLLFHSSSWINAGMINLGVRYYFDTRTKEPDPRLGEDDLPIRKPREKKKKTPKNAVFINVNLTPDMIEQAYRNGGSILLGATEGEARPQTQSEDIESALKVLEEQGEGTVLTNSIQFDALNQLTDESMLVLERIAGSLIKNRTWTKVNILYMSDKQSEQRASIIATYLRAKGVKNLTAKGVDAQTNDATSDLIISIK